MHKRRYEEDLLRELRQKNLGHLIVVGSPTTASDWLCIFIPRGAGHPGPFVSAPNCLPSTDSHHLSLALDLYWITQSDGVITRVVQRFQLHEGKAYISDFRALSFCSRGFARRASEANMESSEINGHTTKEKVRSIERSRTSMFKLHRFAVVGAVRGQPLFRLPPPRTPQEASSWPRTGSSLRQGFADWRSGHIPPRL